MSEFSKDLITKREAAALLGVSLSTFDRARKRLGLNPAASVRMKPVVFVRGDVQRAARGVVVQTNAPARTAAAMLPTAAELKKARASARRGKR